MFTPNQMAELGKVLTTQVSKSALDAENNKFAESFERNQQYSKANGTNQVDFLSAFTLTALEHPELIGGLNRSIRSNAKIRTADGQIPQISLSDTIDHADSLGYETTEVKRNYKRAAGVLDDSTAPGGGNTVQTSLANYLVLRMPTWGKVYNELNKINVPSGNLSVPTMIGRPIATFGTAGTALTNIGTVVEDSTNGIKQTTLTPIQYGVVLPVTNELISKINPGLMVSVTDLVAKALAYGRDYYAIQGTGSTQPLGMLTNATSLTVTTGNTIIDMFSKGYGVLAATGIAKDDMRAFMNGQLEAILMRTVISGSNAWIGQIVDFKEQKVFGIPYTVTESILTTSNTAPLIMGAPSTQYLWGENGDVRMLMDPYSKASSLVTNMIGYSFADAKPALNDSFVKCTLSTNTVAN
jgi:HK97 family phage major capsid protein